ncbi:MAG TPA: tetratricopeptide repeat protein [Puia sp.]|nr:tetratricopeptide repeat protein [Puia sp.]
MSDVKVIKARSEITIGRYLNNLLNTISYTGAESTDIKDLINGSFGDVDKKLFLNNQVAIADDITDPAYSNSSNSPELPVIQYLNAFNTFYSKSDTNSIYFSDVRSSNVKKGKRNMYIDVYFTSFFKNKCLSNPSDPYKPTKRVAEIFIKRSNNNKWLFYISRIGFFNPADTLNDFLDNIVIADPKSKTNPSGRIDETMDSADKFSQYVNEARLEEKKRNYQTAINLYSRAIDLAPKKRDIYEARIKELNTSFRILADLEEKYRAGYYKVAIKEYSEHLKKPKLNAAYSNSDYYLGRAKCLDKMGQLTKSYNEQVKNYNDALQDYAKSYDYDNDNMETIRCRADLYRRMNRSVEALTEYKTYLAKDPTDISVHEAMSDLHMLNGNLDQATKDIDPMLSQENIDPIFKSKLNVDKGVLYCQKKDYSSAEDYFTRAIGLDSNSAFAYYNRGMVRIKMNNIQSAASDFISARRKGLDSTNIKKIDSSAEIIFERGLNAFRIGNIDSALIFIDAAINVNPYKSYYYYVRGECYFSKNNFTESIKAYSLSLSANYHDAYYKRGLANLQLGKTTDAIADFTKSIHYNPQFYLAQKELGNAYFALKDYKNCATNLEACLELRSLRKANSANMISEMYNTIGKAYFNLNDFEKALDNFLSAERTNDRFAEPHFNLGLTQFKKKNLNEAVKEISKALSMDSTHSQWHYYLGRTLQDNGHYDEAMHSYRNAIMMDTAGALPDATYYLGLCYYRIKNYPKALENYRKFLAFHPNEIPSSFNYEIGNIYMNLVNYDSAYSYLIRSYQSDSSNGYILYSMASYIYLRGNTEESLKWFEKSFQTKALERNFVDHDTLLGSLQDNKRFKELKKKYL